MIPFTKMQGIGNDFVMVDTIRDSLPSSDIQSLARAMNDRRFGIGGDGLILLSRGTSAPFQMRMFNPDGSESEMCGNGIRCFAKLLRDHGHISGNQVSVQTGAGTLHLKITEDDRVQVDMGKARLTRTEIGISPGGEEKFVEQPVGAYKATAVSMGNPHIVIFVDDVKAVDLAKEGPGLEHDSLFPMRTNVHFVQLVSRDRLVQRTWERGAGITLACGTGACSVAVAGYLTGRSERKVTVELPGGELEIEYLSSGNVLMTGPAETVFTGSYPTPEPPERFDLMGVREVELLEHV